MKSRLCHQFLSPQGVCQYLRRNTGWTHRFGQRLKGDLEIVMDKSKAGRDAGNPPVVLEQGCVWEESDTGSMCISAVQRSFFNSFLIWGWPFRIIREKEVFVHFISPRRFGVRSTIHLPKIMQTRSFCLVYSQENLTFWTTLALRIRLFLNTPFFSLSLLLHLMACKWCVLLHLCTASLLQVRVKFQSMAQRTAIWHLGESKFESKMCWLH